LMTPFVIILVSEVYGLFRSVVFRRNDRGILIGRTLNLNCCTQQANCNSGLPALLPINTLRMILIFQLEISCLMCICWH